MKIIDTGILFRNPTPHLKSRHGYFPSVIRLPGGELLATYGVGEAFESTDLHTEVARSNDGGASWTEEGPIYPGTPDRLTSECCRITAMPDGSVVAFMVRADRQAHPDEGLANEANLGFADTELLLLRSTDGGKSWVGPDTIDPPLVGPSFELCAPIVQLSDGKWILATSTWRGWDGYEPNGMKMVALMSNDQGNTWPEYADVMADTANKLIFWESKIVEMADGRLLATAWVHEELKGVDRPNHYAVSEDGGRTWTPPASTGLIGQTLTPLVLPNGDILSIYRRMDKVGLWANLSRLDGSEWKNIDEMPLWGYAAGDSASDKSDTMVHAFQTLRFGAPCVLNDPDGVFTAFWCYEDCTSVIRWFRLNATG